MYAARAASVAGRGCDSMARELGCFLQTLAQHQSTSAALCVLWPACLVAEAGRKTRPVADRPESLASVRAPDLLRAFGIDPQGTPGSEPALMPAHAVRSRVGSIAPALSRVRVLRDDQLVLGVPLRRPGGELGGFAAVSVPHLLHRRDVGWYAGCCDLFASTWLDDVATRPPASRPFLAPASLSPREREIARLLANGYSLVNAAAILGLSDNTARTYLRRTYTKLGVCNRVQLVLRLGVSAGRDPV